MTLHRRGRIADLVRERGMMRVTELAELLRVSEVTIRHDLRQLEQEGQLIRDRGGAIPAQGARSGISPVYSVLALEQRSGLHRAEKRRIGRAAAQLVQPGDTIIMDAGTTVVEMVSHLSGVAPLTVVTNALNVAGEVGLATEAQVILLGGTLYRAAASTMGPITEQGLNELVVQKLFLATQAVDLADGLTDTTLEIAYVKRAMLRSARQVILLMDSSKWGKAGFIKVAPLNAINTVISDTDLPDHARADIERLGIELLLV